MQEQCSYPILNLRSTNKLKMLVFSLTRKFLVENGYQLTGDQSKIIIPLEVEWNDMYGSDYEDFETEIPAGQTISISLNDAQELE